MIAYKVEIEVRGETHVTYHKSFNLAHDHLNMYRLDSYRPSLVTIERIQIKEDQEDDDN